ncbi:unnamed protein product, partial [Soboliphyme baturini]|uniref:C2H2-type domain-containing protein n=1 Tax=Soboliphyme baturini TaxID=241478 RepID=A0A183IAK1_9BILA
MSPQRKKKVLGPDSQPCIESGEGNAASGRLDLIYPGKECPVCESGGAFLTYVALIHHIEEVHCPGAVRWLCGKCRKVLSSVRSAASHYSACLGSSRGEGQHRSVEVQDLDPAGTSSRGSSDFDNNKRVGIPSDEGNVEQCAVDSGIVPSRGVTDSIQGGAYYECAICSKRFRTNTGLGVHKQRVHPVEYNRDIPPLKRPRWSIDEMRVMAVAELEMESGVRNVNELIAQKLEGRTVEAIKKRRQTREYKLILEEVAKEHPAEHGGTPTLVVEKPTSRVESTMLEGLLETLEEEVSSGDEAFMKAVTGSL